MYAEFNRQSAGLDMLLMHKLCTLYILGNLIYVLYCIFCNHVSSHVFVYAQLCVRTWLITNLTQQELVNNCTTMQQPGSRSDSDNYARALHKQSAKPSLRASFSVNFLFLRVSLVFVIRCRRVTFFLFLFCLFTSRFFSLLESSETFFFFELFFTCLSIEYNGKNEAKNPHLSFSKFGRIQNCTFPMVKTITSPYRNHRTVVIFGRKQRAV